MTLTPLLTRRAVVQAAIEDVSGTPQAVGANDGILVESPMYMGDAQMLERKFVRDTLSPIAHITGRVTAKMEFTTELRGNGSQNAGTLAASPVIARLFQMCGYALTAHAASTTFGPYQTDPSESDVVWAANATAADNTDVISYKVKVTTPGASGVGKVTVTSDTPGEGSAEQVLTTGTALDLGTKGLVLTPTFADDLKEGQSWTVWLMPPGLALTPISDGFQSGTLVMYKDGVEHTMPGSFGTFTIDAQAGQFATVKWTFTGIWSNPVDNPTPNLIYERTLPAMVELARLQVADFQAVVEKFTYDQKNDVQIRPDVNAYMGYNGTRIVSRMPEGGIDPEATLVADNDFWGQLIAASRMPFQVRVGSEPGNTVWLLAPATQYSGLTYADRNGIMTYDAKLTFSAYQADDELTIYLC